MPILIVRILFKAAGQNTSEEKRESLQQLRAGFALFLTDKALLHLLLLVTATGFLAFGVYLVGMPLLAREAYQGGAGLYATLQVTFTMGIVVANFVVSRQKNTFERPGRLMIISFLGRGGLVAVIALMPNFWILFPVIFVWGAFSGNVDDLWGALFCTIRFLTRIAREPHRSISCVYLPVRLWVHGPVVLP